jgi:hypothetical protein
MRNFVFATTCWLRDWVNHPLRKSLSRPALIPLWRGQSRQPSLVEASEYASSTHIYCKTVFSRRPTSTASPLSKPFNAHSTSIVERFSPTHF